MSLSSSIPSRYETRLRPRLPFSSASFLALPMSISATATSVQVTWLVSFDTLFCYLARSHLTYLKVTAASLRQFRLESLALSFGFPHPSPKGTCNAGNYLSYLNYPNGACHAENSVPENKPFRWWWFRLSWLPASKSATMLSPRRRFPVFTSLWIHPICQRVSNVMVQGNQIEC